MRKMKNCYAVAIVEFFRSYVVGKYSTIVPTLSQKFPMANVQKWEGLMINVDFSGFQNSKISVVFRGLVIGGGDNCKLLSEIISSINFFYLR